MGLILTDKTVPKNALRFTLQLKMAIEVFLILIFELLIESSILRRDVAIFQLIEIIDCFKASLILRIKGKLTSAIGAKFRRNPQL